MTKCKGCGSEFQTENKESKGYVKSMDHEYCFRCFNLRNFNLNIVSIDDSSISNLIDNLNNYDKLIVVVDIFCFSFLEEIIKYNLANKEIILIINKLDLLPKSIDETRIISWVKEEFDSINFQKIMFVSASKKYNIDYALSILEKLKGEIPIIGKANVGKSSIINSMRKSIDPNDESLITISYYPGTTLDKVEWQVNDSLVILDTPGLTYGDEYISNLDKDSLKFFFPKREIKPITFQLQTGQTIFINGFARIDFLNNDPISVTFYMSNEFELHRCKTINADELENNHRGIDVIVPPFASELEKIEFDSEIVTLNKNKKEIELSGFGWIDIHTTKDMDVKIASPNSCHVALRTSIYKEQ